MALTVAPDFSDGTTSAAKFQQLSDAINERTPLRARMSADQAMAGSSTTLQNVTELVLAVEANATYEGQLDLVWTLSSGVTEDGKVGFTFPAGATLDFGGVVPHTAMAAAGSFGDGDFVRRINATSGTTTIAFGASTSVASGVINIDLIVGSTAGNLQVQCAQNVGGAPILTIKAGSKLVLRRVS